MQQKGENVAHAQDGIRPKKLKIQGVTVFEKTPILEGFPTSATDSQMLGPVSS
jgi:hypothetical protein